MRAINIKGWKVYFEKVYVQEQAIKIAVKERNGAHEKFDYVSQKY